jgi:hypothetical protein
MWENPKNQAIANPHKEIARHLSCHEKAEKIKENDNK